MTVPGCSVVRSMPPTRGCTTATRTSPLPGFFASPAARTAGGILLRKYQPQTASSAATQTLSSHHFQVVIAELLVRLMGGVIAHAMPRRWQTNCRRKARHDKEIGQ